MFGIYSNDPNGTGAMLAFGPSETACRESLRIAIGDGDADDNCTCVEVTDALADSDGRSWAWLPGSDKTLACTRLEVEMHELAMDDSI